jgi:hypothetical protein
MAVFIEISPAAVYVCAIAARPDHAPAGARGLDLPPAIFWIVPDAFNTSRTRSGIPVIFPQEKNRAKNAA